MRKGFTLLELLTVVIIIAILASIAVPQFFRAAERARAAEGIATLGSLRSAQLRYCAEYGTTTDSLNNLDVEIGGLKFFNTPTVVGGIDCTDSANNDETIASITRNNNSVPAAYSGYRLEIQLDGSVVCGEGTTCPPGTTME